MREGGFYPGALEKGLRSERALMMALAEMYVHGISTRKVAAITERLCSTRVSAFQVSRAVEQLDEVLEHGTIKEEWDTMICLHERTRRGLYEG